MRANQLPPWLVTPAAIVLTSLGVTAALTGVRHLGRLQRLELAVYDQMVRLRPGRGIDERLLIVAITEADIKAQNRWPLTDQAVADALAALQVHQPRLIGLDIYRDIPHQPGSAALATQLQQENVMVIAKLPDGADQLGVRPPPNIPLERIGFNDLVIDPDGVVRRNLMYVGAEIDHSFAMRLALAYLQAEGIQPQPSAQCNLMLGGTEFVPLQPNSGQYQGADTAGYQILMDYRTSGPLARQVTLTEVLAGRVNPAWVRDKIVLIGTTARSAKDTFVTPYNAAELAEPSMPGVTIHGHNISAVLDVALGLRPLFWYWPGWGEVLWIGLWALLGGSLAWVVRHPLVFSLAGLVLLGGLVGAGYGIFLLYGWVPVATPAFAFAATATIIVVYRAQNAQRQQQMIMKLLGQNTSPEVARALWESRDNLLKAGKLPGQKLTATVLFSDIKNFSTISENMLPEDLLEWLNEYLGAVTHEVQARQGIVNKFIGDGMLAVFGVPLNRYTPVEVAQDAQMAVVCALAMRDRIQELNVTWAERGLPTVAIRVGIFTGPVVVGSIGSKERLEYGVLGDSVNIASRLESYEKQRQSDTCRILIAKETLVHLEDNFEVEAWGPLHLKGKEHTVEVYRVINFKQNSPLQREDAQAVLRHPRPSPTV